jgi:hypothetical protein
MGVKETVERHITSLYVFRANSQARVAILKIKWHAITITAAITPYTTKKTSVKLITQGN